MSITACQQPDDAWQHVPAVMDHGHLPPQREAVQPGSDNEAAVASGTKPEARCVLVQGLVCRSKHPGPVQPGHTSRSESCPNCDYVAAFVLYA